jgi:hypothetical protein
VYAYVEGRERKPCWCNRRDNDQTRKNGKRHMYLRHRRDGARNPDCVIAGITGFDADARKVSNVLVRVVVIVRGSRGGAVVMLVPVRGRPVLVFGMIVPAVCVDVRRRDGGRTDRHDQRKRQRQQTTHEDESTTTARRAVKRLRRVNRATRHANVVGRSNSLRGGRGTTDRYNTRHF